MSRLAVLTLLLATLLAACVGGSAVAPLTARHLPARTATKPFLNMPEVADGALPRLLSETGAFADVRTLTPASGLLPYDLVVPFWSDGADKLRMVAIPDGKVAVSATGEWTFPRGAVFVKTFELATDAANPRLRRRLETRLLVLDRAGGVYGASYRWRADLSDAELVDPAGLREPVVVREASGPRSQIWYYPSREDCVACHNPRTPGQLGPKTRQMNRDFVYAGDTVENQLRHWDRLGLFSTALDEAQANALPRLARADDQSRNLEDRARSYLDVNCAQCHRPGGTVANFDARYETPLNAQNLIEGPVLIDQGIDRPRVISPHDPWRSLILRRTDTNDDTRMPPIARQTIDRQGVALLRQWVLSLPGRDVLPPPAIQPAGGDFKGPIDVSLSTSEPGTEIRFTVDGSAPGPNDQIYKSPIRLEGPTVLRARAYKPGFTRSIVVQQTYLVGGPG